MATVTGILWTRRESVTTAQGSLGGTTGETIRYPREIAIDVTVPAGTTDMDIAAAWERASAHGFVFFCSKNDDDDGTASSLTVKTNSTSSPDDTITLVPGTLTRWLEGYDGSGDKPLNSADVTILYATNSGPVDQRLRISVALDED
jgi:hypothetical protein